ncbi:hypothetical protein GCM10007866_00850 [Gluconobacter albidus]|uniref:Uncharacterized protein n=1 Tax=Gluconobacter albidus TaxID=318683 RepID=A0ABQ5WX66_9PROT|nr:hypothetical protein AA3250_0010 [Gluconobacter albidus NBRC 3250]GLQ67637.1 hypothetical protein GCM10007866_00850 [Gluconobacter albidus]
MSALLPAQAARSPTRPNAAPARMRDRVRTEVRRGKTGLGIGSGHLRKTGLIVSSIHGDCGETRKKGSDGQIF